MSETLPKEELRPIGDDDSTIIELYNEARKIGRAIMHGLGDSKKSRSVTDVVNSAFRKHILPNRESIEELAKEPKRLFGLMRTIIRHQLIDYARERGAKKRPPKDKKVPLDQLDGLVSEGLPFFVDEHPERLALLGEALGELKLEDTQAYEVIEFRYFIGLTNEEIAKLMDVSRKTVQRAHDRGKVGLEKIIREKEG